MILQRNFLVDVVDMIIKCVLVGGLKRDIWYILWLSRWKHDFAEISDWCRWYDHQMCVGWWIKERYLIYFVAFQMKTWFCRDFWLMSSIWSSTTCWVDGLKRNIWNISWLLKWEHLFVEEISSQCRSYGPQMRVGWYIKERCLTDFVAFKMKTRFCRWCFRLMFSDWCHW